MYEKPMTSLKNLVKKLSQWNTLEPVLSKEEFKTLVQLSKKVIWSNPYIRKQIQEHKINIIPSNFYSNIPSIEDIETSFEYKEPGAEVYNHHLFNKDKMNSIIEQLYGYADEFNPPTDGDADNPADFFWKNPAFSYSDAMMYYCMIRHFKPARILEIGSGFSTLVAQAALRKNQTGTLTLIEPYPKPFLKKLDTVDNLIESFVQNIRVHDMLGLVEQSDIWFIDSTHTVKTGSDCLYLYLKIMPQVTKDIPVHSHDIYLPFGYPHKLILEKHIYWTEQYLLYAYMLDNPKIEVLYSSAYAYAFLRNTLNRLMNQKYGSGGSSIWYLLKGSQARQKG